MRIFLMSEEEYTVFGYVLLARREYAFKSTRCVSANQCRLHACLTASVVPFKSGQQVSLVRDESSLEMIDSLEKLTRPEKRNAQ